MSIRLSIAGKGLILVAVPLLFQLALVGVVAERQRGVVEAANSFDYTHEALAASDAILGKLNQLQGAMRGYVLTEDPEFKAPLDRGIREAPLALQKLRSLVVDQPAQQARIRDLEAKVTRFLAWQAARMKETEDGNREKAVAQIAGLGGEHQMEAIRTGLEAFGDEARKGAAELAAERDRLRQQLHRVLLGGGGAAVAITLLLALSFSNGISRRLAALTRNVNRLARGEELAGPIGGRDEISDLDRAFRDMTDALARAEQARLAADAEARKTIALLDRTRDAVFMFDPDTLRFFYVNQGAIDQVGFSREELLSMTPLDIKPQFDETTFVRMVAPLKAGLLDQHLFSTVHRRKDGVDVPVEIILQCIPVNHSRAFVAQVRDITERTRAEETIRLYADIVKSVPMGLLVLRLDDPDDDRSLRIVDVNPTASSLLGFDVNTVQGKRFVEAFPGVTPAMLGTYAGVVRTGASTELEELQYGDERVKTSYWSVKAFPLPDCRVGLAFENISPRKQAEDDIRRLNEDLERRVSERTQELRELSDRIESVLESAGEGILGLDVEGRTSFANPAALRMLGRTLEELQAGIQHELIHHSRPDGSPYPRTECPIYRALTDGTVQDREDEVFWRVDGSSFPVSYTSTPIFKDGQITGAVVVFRDITERKQAEVQLQQLNAELEQRVVGRTRDLQTLNRSLESARSQAEQANRAKSEFLSRMSHELRTPLNSILGFGQRLTRSELAERDQHRVYQIVKAGGHLLDLINEILDLARIEAGRLTVSMEALPLETALMDVLDLVRPLARDLQIDLRLEPVPTGWCVAADKQRLRQVLLNLLSNAIKYNRQYGTVTLRCSEPEPGRVRLAVEDTGAGIPAEKLPLLFQPFERLGFTGSAVEGTGLGLSLAQKLVELMAGRISVDSTVGVGTIVSVDLPRATPPAARAATKATTSTAPLAAQRSLLYVEDNLANVNLVEDILQDRPSYRLLTAMQGGLGLDLVRQHRPDLILLDVHLPDMLGDEFLRRLKADPAIQQIPVVVLSADATARQIKTLQDLGASAYLTKPIDADKFLSIIDGFLHS